VLRILPTIWGTILASQVLYFVLAAGGFLRNPDASLPAGPPWLPLVLAGLAVPFVVLAHLVRGRTLAAEGRPRPAGYIVSWALIEAVAILGLVLAVLGFGSAAWAPLMGVATGLMFLHSPPRPSNEP
jgi:hypothetical protein